MSRVITLVASEGFEPPKLKTSDLQSDPFGRLGNLPERSRPRVITCPDALNKNTRRWRFLCSRLARDEERGSRVDRHRSGDDVRQTLHVNRLLDGLAIGEC